MPFHDPPPQGVLSVQHCLGADCNPWALCVTNRSIGPPAVPPVRTYPNTNSGYRAGGAPVFCASPGPPLLGALVPSAGALRAQDGRRTGFWFVGVGEGPPGKQPQRAHRAGGETGQPTATDLETALPVRASAGVLAKGRGLRLRNKAVGRGRSGMPHIFMQASAHVEVRRHTAGCIPYATDQEDQPHPSGANTWKNAARAVHAVQSWVPTRGYLPPSVPSPLGTEGGRYLPKGGWVPRELGVRWVGRGSWLCAVRRAVRSGVL